MENFKCFTPISLPATPCGGIFSPSPQRKAGMAKINSHVARELFSAEVEESSMDVIIRRTETPSNFMKAKFISLKGESEASTKSSGEWSSDSGCSNYIDMDFEAPKKPMLKNPFNQDQIFEEIACGVPSRASNPIINDNEFRTNEIALFASPNPNAPGSKILKRIADFY